jgi:hypothetical protein
MLKERVGLLPPPQPKASTAVRLRHVSVIQVRTNTSSQAFAWGIIQATPAKVAGRCGKAAGTFLLLFMGKGVIITAWDWLLTAGT